MHKRIAASLMFAAAALCSAQVPSHTPTINTSAFESAAMQSSGKPVLRVNGTVMTDRELVREMMVLFPYARQHGGQIPKAMEPDIRRGALQMMVFEELVYQQAMREQLFVAPAQIEKGITDFRAQFNSAAEFQSYVKQEYQGSMDVFRRNVRRALLIQKFLDRDVNSKVHLSEADVRAFYDSHLARFAVPETVSLQTISLIIPDNATPEQEAAVRARAEDALRQARAAKDYEQFGMLAEKLSEDNWHVMMGDHHEVSRDKMPPQVADIVFKMQPGTVSGIIRAENSWCIARVNAHDAPKQAAFAAVKDGLKRELEATKVEELRQALHRRLRDKAKVELL